MTKNNSLTAPRKLGWFADQQDGHLVQFYNSEIDLMIPLSEYIGSGLRHGSSCIVIATSAHRQSLVDQLSDDNIDVAAARKSGQFIDLDAEETLAKFMVDDKPDRNRFFKVVGSMLKKADQNGKTIRAYGEMVALLWAQGNKDAVNKLESLWNELAESYPFSLYCAYPQLHFILDNIEHDEICKNHTIELPSTITA